MKAFLLLSLKLGVFLVALVAAAGSLAANGGRFNDRLDVLSHLAPLWLAAALTAGAVWLFVRQGWGAPLLCAVAVAASLALMAPELTAAVTARRHPPSGETLKVIQFNGWAYNRDPEASAAWIIAQDPDVLILQEVEIAPGSAASRMAGHFSGSTSCAEPVRACSTVIYHHREPLAQGGAMTSWSEPFLAAAWVTLPGENGPFTVVGTHHVWPTSPRQRIQLERLATIVDGFDKGPLIVSGDFNLTPWSAVLRRQDRRFGLERRTRALFTWPSWQFTGRRLLPPFPFLPIDHVYAGPEWRTVAVERGPMLGSDHYPVVITLTRGR